MADKLTPEQQLKALQEENAKLKARVDEVEGALTERDALLSDSKVATPIKGSYKDHGFKDGHKAVRGDGGDIVPTEALLQLANGKKPEEATLLAYPQLARYLTEGKPNGKAAAFMDMLIEKEYGYLKKA